MDLEDLLNNILQESGFSKIESQFQTAFSSNGGYIIFIMDNNILYMKGAVLKRLEYNIYDHGGAYDIAAAINMMINLGSPTEDLQQLRDALLKLSTYKI